MRKVLLSTLVVFGFMNFCFAQFNANIERITVRTFDTNGLVKKFHVTGNKVQEFDIPAFIKENDHLDRVLINGIIIKNLSTTKIKFDSNEAQMLDGENICKEVETTATPFLGVWGNGRNDFEGVYVKEVILGTSADAAGITAKAIITEFDGATISRFHDLKEAVRTSEIGDRVELKLKNGADEYSKYVTVGGRESNIISYNYCEEEQIEVLEKSNLSEATISTFPNPTTSITNVNFKSSSDADVTFSVMDITGNLIHKEVYSNFNGDLSLDYNFKGLSGGTYIITILQGKEILKRKVQLIK